jgi:hypothetical protein
VSGPPPNPRWRAGLLFLFDSSIRQLQIGGDFMMAPEKSEKCAHLPCLCVPAKGEKYCSELCKEAGAGETEIACDCGHKACAQ